MIRNNLRFGRWIFGFRICLEFRYSNFGFNLKRHEHHKLNLESKNKKCKHHP